MPADNKALDLLIKATESHTPCEPVRHHIPEGDVDMAYAVQRALNEKRVAKGSKVIGSKVGITSKSVQQQLGVSSPDFGTLFDDMLVADGSTISFKDLWQPKVEAEVAFKMKTDLSGEKISRVKLIGAIESVHICIEVVGSRVKDWDIEIIDTIADNASSSHFVLGKRKSQLMEVDLQRGRMELRKNGEVVTKGMTGDCLDSPMNSLTWLAEKLTALERPIKAGDIILTGAVGSLVDVEPGDKIEATIDGLGTCSVNFEN